MKLAEGFLSFSLLLRRSSEECLIWLVIKERTTLLRRGQLNRCEHCASKFSSPRPGISFLRYLAALEKKELLFDPAQGLIFII